MVELRFWLNSYFNICILFVCFVFVAKRRFEICMWHHKIGWRLNEIDKSWILFIFDLCNDDVLPLTAHQKTNKKLILLNLRSFFRYTLHVPINIHGYRSKSFWIAYGNMCGLLSISTSTLQEDRRFCTVSTAKCSMVLKQYFAFFSSFYL